MVQTPLLLALALAGGLALVACSAISPGGSALEGTRWTLTTLAGQPVLAGTTVTLNFENGRVTGSDGCNSYSSAYAINGNTITIDERVIGTKRGCPEPILQQADAFIAALVSAKAFTTDSGQLTLVDGAGQPLAVFAAQNTTLAGTTWTVTGVNTGNQAVVSVLTGSTMTLEFGADGRLAGSGGCNRYTASFESTGSTLTISQAGATRRACFEPEGIMEQEALFFKALETVATYRIDGNHLELRTADGALAISAISAR